MGIRFTCPSGHQLHVKTFLAGKRGVCPHCGAKFVIPTPQESQQSARPALDSLQHSSGESFTATRIAAPPGTASASIIIATADERLADASPADRGSSEIRLAESFGSPTTADPPVPPPIAPPPPTIDAAIGAVESPAVHHVSRRRRHRRQQLNTAIVLLVTVILLALILIWVVQRGASEASAGEMKSNRFGNAWPAVTILCDFVVGHFSFGTHHCE